MKLAVGGLEESVTVSAEAPLVETANATLGIVVDEQKVVELPLNGRNFTQLGTLLPGVVAPPAALGGAAGDATPGGFGAATVGFSVNGMRNQSNNFLLDGASNNDTFNTGFVMRPPPDAIQEFKILTHSYTRGVRAERRIGRQRRVEGAAPTRCTAPPGSSTATMRCRRGTSSRRRPGQAEAEAEPVRRSASAGRSCRIGSSGSATTRASATRAATRRTSSC